jgi:hypothetical protein
VLSFPNNIKHNWKIINVKKQTNVAVIACFPIYFDIFSSFSSINVYCSLISKSPSFLYLDSIQFSPTAHTIAFPYPDIILVFAKRKGSGFNLWLSYSKLFPP